MISRISLALGLSLALAGGLRAQPEIDLRLVASGFTHPLFLTHAGDGSGRLFVCEKEGLIRIITAGGVVLPQPFLDLTTRVSMSSEQGLLGLAFHPDFASNRQFFVQYTDLSGASVVSRFTVPAATPNVADPSSEQIVLGPVSQPQANHNGGMIAFGPLDGYLYIGLGDGGGAGDVGSGHTPGIGNAQDTTNLLGTILRIDVDGGSPYAIPPDNPFVGDPGGLDEIYAYGLRNPWRFSFDRGGDHRLFAGDVGQNRREEIDIVTSGANCGWRVLEGDEWFNVNDFNSPLPSGTEPPDHVPPIHVYGRTEGASVTGGHVYRGNAHPALQGLYICGDFITGRIWALEETSPGSWINTELLDTAFLISSFGEDEGGELYVVSYGDGTIHRIVTTASSSVTGMVYR